MKQKTKILKEEYKKHYKSNKEFILANDWTKAEAPYSVYETERSIIKNMLDSFSSFLEEIETDRYLKDIEKFVKEFSVIITIHIKRIEEYMNDSQKIKEITEDIEKLTLLLEDGEASDKAIRGELKTLNANKGKEVKFRNDIFSDKVSTKLKMAEMRVSDDSNIEEISPDLYFSDMKASLLMRPILTKVDTFVERRTNALEIDFSAAHINPATSNEMLINMKPSDIPPYDPTRHFFEQEKSTIQFWEEEKRKAIEGIVIGGYHIHPFLYWHLNLFKTSIGSGHNKRVTHPNFWDNDFYFVEMLKKAEKIGNVGIFMYGTRRASKSVKMTSFTQWKLHTIPNATGSLIGFSKEDLTAILDYTQINLQYMHPAFKTELLLSTMDSGIQLGVRHKNGREKFVLGSTLILNLEGGSAAGGLKTASATPDFLAIDEAGKGGVIPPWEAAKASFTEEDSENWRTIPLLSGTAGNDKLSEDAEKMLSNPEAFNILPMDWDLYDEHIEKEYHTWEKENFALFVPAQMSLKGPRKRQTDLGTFLGDGNKELKTVKMFETDWPKANKYFEEERKKLEKAPETLAAEQKNFPLTPSDCLISTEYNPYPALEAKKRRIYIDDNEETGRRVDLFKDMDGVIKAQNSSKEILTEYPFRGGNFDAPVVLLDEIEEGKIPKFGLYVIGLDDIKHNRTSGDSVYSVSMFKRGYDGGEFGNRFAGYYHTRPNRKEDAYKQTYYLMKMYNCIVNPENDDEGFVEWVSANHPEDLYHIADGIDFANFNNMHRNSNRKFGTSTDPRNILFIERKLQSYMKSDKFILDGVDGLLGVQVTNDPMLLEEIYKYKPKNNADRLRSAALAYSYANFLDKFNIHMYLSDNDYYNSNIKRREEKPERISIWGQNYDAEIKIW